MLLFYYVACAGEHEFYHQALDQCWELQSETPAEGFYALRHGVYIFARGEENVLVTQGEVLDVFVNSNMETWISKNNGLCETVLIFLVGLIQES